MHARIKSGEGSVHAAMEPAMELVLCDSGSHAVPFAVSSFSQDGPGSGGEG